MVHGEMLGSFLLNAFPVATASGSDTEVNDLFCASSHEPSI
jgi:hypothetical protein